MIKLSQGEAFEIEFTLEARDGTSITPSIVTEVEATCGDMTKLYSTGEIYYDGEGIWVFPLTQEETMKMSGIRPLKARAKFSDEQVGKAELGPVVVYREKSRRKL